MLLLRLQLLQARVLLRLNRPVDVAERGLVFVQNFLGLLAAKEAAGQLKPWLKEVRGRELCGGVCVGWFVAAWPDLVRCDIS